jgi:hypothetical protein
MKILLYLVRPFYKKSLVLLQVPTLLSARLGAFHKLCNKDFAVFAVFDQLISTFTK